MKNLKTFISDFKNTYSIDEKLLVIAFTSLFLPWFLSIVVIIGLAFYIFFKTDYKKVIKETKGGTILMVLPIYLFVVSIFHKNWYGAIVSLMMFLMFIIVLYFRRHINVRVFHAIIEIAIFASIICVIYGIFEQLYYMSEFTGMTFFDIQDSAQYRVHTFFYNANYYALVILYVECMCVYKFFLYRKESLGPTIYYTVVGLINILPMYLTGGRTVWLVFAMGITIMLVVKRWWKMLAVALGLEATTAYLLKTFPNLIPRLALNGLNVERRKQIWQAAILMIKDHGLFGGGPYLYFDLYKEYEKLYIETYGMESFKEYPSGIKSPHSHSLFTEPFLSLGLIGTCMFGLYMVEQCKSIVKIIKVHKDYALASFICGCLMMTIGYSIMDFPILWHQTGYLLMLILGCSEIYREETSVC